MATFVDYYAVLGIEPSANLNEIKKAYRQLALKHHPDKAAPGSKPDSSKFISALAAYEVLVDDSKRKAYDVQYNKASNGTATYSATRATQHRKRKASGGFSGGFWSHPARDGDGINVPGAYPSEDEASESDYQYEETDAYEYACGDGERYFHSCCTGESSFDNTSLYSEGSDATDNRSQSPHDLTEDVSPAQGCGSESGAETELRRGDEKKASSIADPISGAFDILEDILESQYLGDKVKGRYYDNALDELRLQKGRCKEIDNKLDDIDARMRRRVGDMPAGSIPLQEFDNSLKRRIIAAHRTVSAAQLEVERAIFIMRHEKKPGSWKANDKTTRGVISTIEKSADVLSQMRQGLTGLEYIMVKMEGWANSDLRQLKGCLFSFMSDLRDWSEEIASRT
ncbi:hypothetical protein KVR01_003117 [Diaporthe batatas]|uniref:uncharacterized protein n=1 Tax=Diaporthe batatas TaxID=748121 RepID=UPI001D0379A9|nr:uncharacterized protein KVR01_003117 [Diaporthe batatas]KAG8167428.1 hypothetical protein KVR01_003117 [Diaporthe batatas]